MTDRLLAGLLELATTPVPGEAILPLVLARFRQRFPRVQARASIGDASWVAERLQRGEAELGLVGGPYSQPGLTAEFLARDELVLIARRDHPLAARQPVRAREVCQHPLVLRGEGSGARIAVEQALTSAGVASESIEIAAELGSTEAVRRAVEAGLGVGFVSVCTLAAAGPAGEVRALTMADEPPARDLLLLTIADRPLSRQAEAFRRFLLDEERRLELAAHTRLPSRLRPTGEPDRPGPSEPGRRVVPPKVSPMRGLEQDPLLPPPNGAPLRYRLGRLPRTPDEQLVAQALTSGQQLTRQALIERLADALRRQDPLARLPEAGPFGLELYKEEATTRVDGLVGDLLIPS